MSTDIVYFNGQRVPQHLLDAMRAAKQRGDVAPAVQQPARSPQSACPMCPGRGQALGKLGRATAYRCRDCGWTFQRTREAA